MCSGHDRKEVPSPPPIPAYEALLSKALEALDDLHATVWGECPQLLNEDSGGNSNLDLDCREAIAELWAALNATKEHGK